MEWYGYLIFGAFGFIVTGLFVWWIIWLDRDTNRKVEALRKELMDDRDKGVK